MRIFLVLLSLLAAGNTKAQTKAPNWNDLEIDSAYHVAADIKLEDGTIIPAGRVLVLLDVASLDVPALALRFKDTACTNMDLKTPMSLFNPTPNDTSDNNSVGVEYETNCEVGVYVETKDFYDQSIFQ